MAVIVGCSGDLGEGDSPSGAGSTSAGGASAPTGTGGNGGGGFQGFDFDAAMPSGPRLDATIASPVTGAGTLERLRIEPSNAVLTVVDGAVVQQGFKVFGTFVGQSGETEITDRSVFYVADNHTLGTFDANGPTFATNANAPRGGYAIVAALAANPDGGTVETRTGILVKVDTEFADPRDDGSATFDVPADANTLFSGPEDSARAPTIVYPNDETLLPPNLNRFAVHFQPGSSNTLFEVRFESQLLSLRYHMRCGAATAGGCIFELDEKGYLMVAETNRGASPVTIEVLGTDDAGAAVGRSQKISVQFAQDDVNGGLYYWSTTSPLSIMRFNFGVRNAVPETFLAEGRDTSACVGCHAISPDGRKVVASLNGQNNGQQILVNDLTVPNTDPTFLDRNGSDNADRLQFASFKADGSEFTAVFGDTGDLQARNTLWFHDGDTGVRIAGRELVFDFEPDHPDWSGDGDTIVMSRVGIHNTSQKPGNCGIEMIRRDGPNWGAPETIVPVVVGDGKSHYNPDFVPDDAFFVFSESTCPTMADEGHRDCDADCDPSAKTWAAVAEPGATPVYLANAAAPGVMDNGATDLSDTFPRGAPFRSTFLGPDQALDADVVRRPIYWVTVSSLRRVGLQNGRKGRQLWMFAVDPAKVLAGEDGSFPAFHLPFQDLATDNHIGQWTRTIVSDEPPPEPPAPPPPPTIPPPPVPE